MEHWWNEKKTFSRGVGVRALSVSGPRDWDTVLLTGYGLGSSGERLSVWTDLDSLVIKIR